jgi:hypothetical protein
MFDRLETDHMQLNELNPTSVLAENLGAKHHSSGRSESPRTPISRDIETVARYKAVPEHLHCDLNGEAVVLSLANGRYYGMNSVGARIWELLQDERSADEIEQAILLEYEVEQEVCRQQVSDFLQKMVAEELLVVTHESGSEIP